MKLGLGRSLFSSRKKVWWPMVAQKKVHFGRFNPENHPLSYLLFSILLSDSIALEHEARRALTNFSERCGSVAQGRRCCGHGAAVGLAILWFLKS